MPKIFWQLSIVHVMFMPKGLSVAIGSLFEITIWSFVINCMFFFSWDLLLFKLRMLSDIFLLRENFPLLHKPVLKYSLLWKMFLICCFILVMLFLLRYFVISKLILVNSCYTLINGLFLRISYLTLMCNYMSSLVLISLNI